MKYLVVVKGAEPGLMVRLERSMKPLLSTSERDRTRLWAGMGHDSRYGCLEFRIEGKLLQEDSMRILDDDARVAWEIVDSIKKVEEKVDILILFCSDSLLLEIPKQWGEKTGWVIDPPILREGEALIIPTSGSSLMHVEWSTTGSQVAAFVTHTAST